MWRKMDALFETSDRLAVKGANVVDAVFEGGVDNVSLTLLDE